MAQTGWPAEAQVQFLLSQFELQSQHYAKFRPNAERMVIEREGAPTAYFAMNYVPAPRTPYGTRIAITREILRREKLLP